VDLPADAVRTATRAELRRSSRDVAPEIIQALLDDPIKFARGILRLEPWAMQERTLAAVSRNSKVAIRACHASGKTFIAAAVALHFLSRYPDAIVIVTAPTWLQIQRVFFGEVHRALANSLISWPITNATEIRISPKNYLIGVSTDDAARFSGYHSEHLLIVLDEAPGVLPMIWEAIDGIRAGGEVRMLAIGNPTVASGPFFEIFSGARPGWETLTISAFDTPNLSSLRKDPDEPTHVTLSTLLELPDEELDVAVLPFLTTRRWVREMHGYWGESHPMWQARVLGQFPAQSEDALISLSWIEAAKARTVNHAGHPILCAGVDVAGPGKDETALVVRWGDEIVLEKAWAQSDPRGLLVNELERFRQVDGFRVFVDSIGMGHYFAEHLKDVGFAVHPVNVATSPHDGSKFANLKAELYWGLRQRFSGGHVAGAMTDKTVSQLSSIRYSYDSKGRLAIESKDEMARRGVKSPDRAEAMMLAFAESPACGGPVDIRRLVHIGRR